MRTGAWTVCLMFMSTLSTAQSGRYWDYYDKINEAEAACVAGEAHRGLPLYEQAFGMVEHPFTKDKVIAAQFALHAKDTLRCLGYFRSAATDGMTRAAAEQIPMLRAALVDQRFQQLFDERPETPPWVDPLLRDSVYMHFYREQKVKEVMGRDPELRARMQRVTDANISAWTEHLTQGRFPSERMIGLYTEEGFSDFIKRYGLEPFRDVAPPNIPGMTFGAPIPEDIDLINKTAWVDLLHAPCAWLTLRQELWTAVGNGYLHPKDVCGLEEWLVKSRGNPNYVDVCDVKREPSYYNILFELRVEDPEGLKRVEAARREHHLQSYAVDRLKRQLETDRGMVLFFGFLRWR